MPAKIVKEKGKERRGNNKITFLDYGIKGFSEF